MQLKTKNTILAVDVDGVVYPYQAMMQKQLKATFKDKSRYKLHEALNNVSVEDVHRTHLQLFKTVASHSAPPIQGAIDSLHNLHKLGIEIVFVTARANYTKRLTGKDQSTKDITQAWLKSWAPPHQVYFVQDKIDYDGHYDCLIDDRPKEIDLLLDGGKNAICYEQPYNQNYRRALRWRWRADGKIDRLLEILNNFSKPQTP